VIAFFKALADETRLRLTGVLRHHELNVGEIVGLLEMGQSRISRHLKILTDAGLVCSRREGLRTFYSASSAGGPHRFLESIRFVFDSDEMFRRDVEAAKRIIEERRRKTLHFFDTIAEDWDQLKRDIIGDFDLNGLILQNLNRRGTVVDLGCGTGDLLRVLAPHVAKIIGVDKSANMLTKAKAAANTKEHGDLDLRLGAIEHLPLRDREAEAAILNMVLHHLTTPTAAFDEVGRILKRGGQFVIVDFVNHQHEEMHATYGDQWLGFQPGDIRTWLLDSGFSPGSATLFDLKRGLRGFIVSASKP